MSKIVDMCEECKKKNGWKFCPYSGEESKPESKATMTQERFDEIFLDLLKDARKVVWLRPNGKKSELPTFRFELRNSDNEWMFDISLDPKNQHFWFSTKRVQKLFSEEYDLEYEDIQRLMKKQLKALFNLNDVTPVILPHMCEI